MRNQKEIKSSFKTPAGTELPILNLKGKEYLQVAHRLVWFRELHPTGSIKTQAIEIKEDSAIFTAVITVMDPQVGPVVIAQGTKKETKQGFGDFVEKAETGAIGRALAIAGFGTQFTGDEMDEGDRLADAPVDVPKKTVVAEPKTVTVVDELPEPPHIEPKDESDGPTEPTEEPKTGAFQRRRPIGRSRG